MTYKKGVLVEREQKWVEDTTMKTTAKILLFLILLLNPAAVEKVVGLTMGNALLRAKIAIANIKIKVRKQNHFSSSLVSDPMIK